METKKLLKIFLIILGGVIIIAGINPASRIVWFLESMGIFIIAVLLVYHRDKINFSNLAYSLIFIYLFLGAIGAHYSFENVPIKNLQEILGTKKDPHDRFVHFSFGLFLYYPILEFFKRTTKLKDNFWIYFVPFMIISGIGAFYEIAEWSVGMAIDPENTYEFLGMVGDEWDAQKDMLINSLGAFVSMIIVMITKPHRFAIIKK